MMRPAVRGLQALLWTAGVFGGLWLLDRGLIGPEAPTGWQVAATVGDVPAGAGAPLSPSYLPAELGWPPRKILWQNKPQQGWWLQFGQGDQPQLWIGAGSLPPGHPAPGCMGDGSCPPGWHGLSRRIGGQAIGATTTLPAHTLRLIMDGLRPASR